MKTTLNDYTTEQLQKELDKRNLEKYSDYEIQEEIKIRNKNRSHSIIYNNKALLSACHKYCIDIDNIENIDTEYINPPIDRIKHHFIDWNGYLYREELVCIHTNDFRYLLKRNSGSDEYIMDSIGKEYII